MTPRRSAAALDISTTALAPSLSCEALPAVTVPSLSNAGLRPARLSGVVPGRTPSSCSTTIGSPLRWGIATGAISSAKRPSLMAFAARSCDAAASSSWAARLIDPAA